jgi:hypothetical protein
MGRRAVIGWWGDNLSETIVPGCCCVITARWIAVVPGNRGERYGGGRGIADAVDRGGGEVDRRYGRGWV